jgi:hypothetical protein
MAEDTLESILGNARLSADERKLFEKTLNDNPELKKGWLRQSDYSRNMDQVTARKKEYDEAIALKEKTSAWYERVKPTWDTLLEAGAVNEEGEPLWPTEKQRMAKELEDAKRAVVAGADMDPAELDKRVREIVKANGGATQEEIKALILSEGVKLAEEAVNRKYAEFQKEFNEKTIPFNMGMSAANSLAASDYEKVTGEEFTEDKQKELFALMSKENNFNPRAAMKIMLEPVKQKKAQAEEIKVQATKMAEEMLRARGELAEDQPFIPLPEKTVQPKGSLQKLMELSSDSDADPSTLIAAAASKAAAELRAEGK